LRVDGSALASSEPVRALSPLAERFVAAGHRLYLVGGCVRDLLLGHADGHDLDCTTDARPDVIKRLVAPLATAVWNQGERFGTIGAEIDGRSVEITTFRAERYDPTSRKPAVTFGDDLIEDLSRRDFTINAIALSLHDGALIDPYDGAADLRDVWLRTPLAPEVSFGDDPLRMLRAARFASRFDLRVDPGVRTAMAAMALRMEVVSRERVHDELWKLLSLANPAAGLHLLVDSGVSAHVFSPLDQAGLDRALALGSGVDAVTAMTAIVLPLDDDAIRRALTVELRCSAEEIRAIRQLARAVRELPEPATAAAVRAWAQQIGPRAADAIHIAHAVIGRRSAAVQAMLSELRETEDPTDASLPVDGADVMRELVVGEGRVVGEALEHLRALRIEHGPLTREEALHALRAWYRPAP
jgi:poly(A) polymerase